VPLKLVTGPANAAKAGAVLGSLRERLAESPVLVVPAFEDVEHSQRELADRGAIFGTRVLRFGALYRLIAERTGSDDRCASPLQRTLIVEEAVRAARLHVLAASAQGAGFARAAERLVVELGRSVRDLTPGRFTNAVRAWTADGPRARYAEELADIYRRYRAGLEAAGVVDRELAARNALAALVRRPGSWGGSPVFVYGFDDFDALQLDTLEELAGATDVTVSLPFEAGREAFRATARMRGHLVEERAAEETRLQAVADHYHPASRVPLHALERGLFQPTTTPVPADGAVRLHSAGGERAEVELCGAEVLALLRDGTPPGEVAVVFRAPDRYGSLIEQVFGAYGVPYSIDRAVRFGHTAVGRGLLALLRCALLEGGADDLLAYLRTPGLLREPALADRLESDVRRAGVRTASEARRVWERTAGRWPLIELDRLARAGGAQPGRWPGEHRTPSAQAKPDTALVAELDERLGELFAAPYRRAAAVLTGAQLDDARAFRAARGALAELTAVAAGGRARSDARRVHDMLDALAVRVGDDPQPDRVQVAAPEAIRARRFEAVFVCGLQEGEFPRPASPEAFLPDVDRRELARASGVALPLREDQLDRERYLFYVCASRAERLLVLSSRYCDEQGDPESASPFVDDARAVLSGLDDDVRLRSLADVTWTPEQAPTAAEWERAIAHRGPRAPVREVGPLAEPAAIAALPVSEAVSAGALEHFAGCPVRWLVEDVLRPDKLEPDPEQMVRGSYAHRVLELTLRGLRQETGQRRVTRANLGHAERLLLAAVRREQAEFRLAPDQTRVRAAVRRLEFDLLRYLRHEAERDGLFEPEHLELRFGLDPDGHPAVELADGMRVRGVIDRIDTWNGYALIRDYKSGQAATYKFADWERENRFQVALYMLVAQRLLDLEPAGGVYVPLGGKERRPRGLVAAELRHALGSDFYENDMRGPEEFEQIGVWAQEAIATVARRMRQGRLESCPDSCLWRGGCSYPSICRIET